MMQVNLIAIGKLKESWLRDACAEYAKRLGAFCKIAVTELPESRLSDNPGVKEIAAALDTEAAQFRGAMGVKQSAVTCALCIEGKTLTSEAFSRWIDDRAVAGASRLNLLIGSSHGLSEALKAESDFRFSLSPMTFPHQLARVMLLEQLYRAFSISANTKYHK